MNRISELRTALGISMKEAAARLDMPYTTYVNYEKGTREPNSETLIKLSRFFGTSIDYLLGKPYTGDVPPGFSPMPDMDTVPLVGRIACGEPITAEENIEDYVDVPENVQCDFCLRCKGDSMIDAGIHDGDLVYIHIQPEVENGQIAAVRIDGEATLKRVFWDKGSQVLQLVPANSSYMPKVYSGQDLESVHIEGRAVGFTHWF